MNLARIDLPSLRLVVLCAEAGSLSAAAPRAALSVAGASYKLRSFEKLVGVRIFEREWNGLAATRAGAAIVADCREIIDRLDAIARLGSNRGGMTAGVCPACGAPRSENLP
jgi:DNA-binding transcriptional LysR family regulator